MTHLTEISLQQENAHQQHSFANIVHKTIEMAFANDETKLSAKVRRTSICFM